MGELERVIFIFSVCCSGRPWGTQDFLGRAIPDTLTDRSSLCVMFVKGFGFSALLLAA